MIRLDLLVLYVSDLDASREFYAALGLDLVREQHGGPVHYAAQLDIVAAQNQFVDAAKMVVIGSGAQRAVARLRAGGFTVQRTGLAMDPDGNRVQLSAAGS